MMNAKVGRNDPCPCGSGKKFKKCCEGDPNASFDVTESTSTPERQARSSTSRGMFRRGPKIPIKTPEQIEGIRKAGALTSDILTQLNDIIKPGVTTKDIDTFVNGYMTERGGTPATLGYRGFPASCCTSLNDVICHGIPDDTILKSGDIINVDVTSILDGYFGDSCRMYTVGDVDPEAKKLIKVTKECLQASMDVVRPGCTLGDIGHAIQHHAESHGYSVVREYTGHGVGLAFHEEPQVLHYGTPGRGAVLDEGMVFTIEPMINAGHYKSKLLPDNWTAVTADGTLSAQWEHTIAITANGVDILTAE